jgi:hypothetical protein
MSLVIRSVVVRSVVVRVAVDIGDREPVERVIGAGGDEWRECLYDLRTEDDVLDHWAYNAVVNGIRDVSELDGWADVLRGTVTFRVLDAI